MDKIPFNRPFIIGKELYYISQSVLSGHIAGDGIFTKKCHELLENKFNIKKVLLTTSCTSALEMSSILIGIGMGDEVVLPSFTFVSTANAFCLRGAKPVFVDIRRDTLNIDENLIENSITSNSKAIIPVHYGGVSCEMDTIMEIAQEHDLFVIEDAAQAMNATYKGRYLGTIGNLGAFSFHETKNCICGEGGALLINDDGFLDRAEIIREKGTNRSQFFRGEVDKYTWVDEGSSYLPSDLLAAFLYAQLENMDTIDKKRKKIFSYYLEAFSVLAAKELIQLPFIPPECGPCGHLFYIIVKDEKTRDGLLNYLRSQDIGAVFHYIPLHLSPMGKKFGYKSGDLPATESLSKRLIRLPLFYELTQNDQDRIVDNIAKYLNGL